jgi:GH43 family beta-xylosidase
LNHDILSGRVPLLDSGADPWVLRHGNEYLYCHSTGDAVWVRRASSLTGLAKAKSVLAWRGPAGGPFSKELWAPELHATDSGWVIYVAADDGHNHNHRMVALVRRNSDPCGEYEFHGKLALEPDRWAIDGTLLRHPDRGLFFVWSGWEGKENVAQYLYICPMRDPLTISGPRVLISSPTFPWEQRGAGGPDKLPTINEGPQVLQRDGWVHVAYSAAGSWSDHYCLGLLSLPPGADPLDPAAWRKASAPVFESTVGIKAPGHASFAVDSAGTHWIVYHSARRPGSGWDRQVRLQPFRWNGAQPVFGAPGIPSLPPPASAGG